MPCTLTTWAVVQALMNVNVTVEAEVLLAFWARNSGTRFISCVKNIEQDYSEKTWKFRELENIS